MQQKTLTVGGGRFWATDAIFRRTRGVLDVKSGFSGGSTEDPTYQNVSTGSTGHAEVVLITYDPIKISLQGLLMIHLSTHNPTLLNEQETDGGTQFRSVIFYGNEAEKKVAEIIIQNFRNCFRDPIITELRPVEKFYSADELHQDYCNKNPADPYCRVVVVRKLAEQRNVLTNYISHL
jgi:peptide methionine sulfoxide reductase msrA/msrB